MVRVDLRGAGDSEGLMVDEYTNEELQDGFDVIGWIAGQDWCDGNVGMMGISWGGFNALQVAALQPPALKAIITCCSTDDRYADERRKRSLLHMPLPPTHAITPSASAATGRMHGSGRRAGLLSAVKASRPLIGKRRPDRLSPDG